MSEYLLKFPDEVEVFWQRKWTGASVPFFTYRSIALLHQVLATVNVLVLTKEVRDPYGLDLRLPPDETAQRYIFKLPRQILWCMTVVISF